PLQGDGDAEARGLAVELELHLAADLDQVAGDGLRLGEELDEGDDPALAVEDPLPAAAAVAEGDPHPRVQVGELAEALGEDLVVDVEAGEDQRVGVEGAAGAAALRGAEDDDVVDDLAALEAGLVGLAVAPDLEAEPVAEGVDDR